MKPIIVALLLLVQGSVTAGPGREALDAFLDDLTTLQATFEQSVLDTENATAGQMWDHHREAGRPDQLDGVVVTDEDGHYKIEVRPSEVIPYLPSRTISVCWPSGTFSGRWAAATTTRSATLSASPYSSWKSRVRDV